MTSLNTTTDINDKIRSLESALMEARKELDKRYKEFGLIYGVIKAMHSTLDIEELEKVIRDVLERTLKLKSYVLKIFDPFEKEYKYEVSKNFSKKEVKHAKVKFSQIKEEVDDFKSVDLKEDGSNNSLICMPLKAHRKFIGILCTETEAAKKLTTDQKEIVSVFANQAAIAIENSLLFDIAKKMAVVDCQTGLYNHYYLKAHLNQEFVRAKRYNRKLSVVMADVDKFKAYNDRFGHPAGDDVLKEGGVVLKKTCRDADLVARYGGDEFAIVLTETDKKGALIACKKMHKAFLAHNFNGKVKRDQKVDISFGVATYPDDSDSSKELINNADKALYQAKKAGGSLIVAFDNDKIK